MIRCMINPSLGPPLPLSERPTSMREVWIEFFLGLVPPGSTGARGTGQHRLRSRDSYRRRRLRPVGSLVLTAAYGRLTWRNFQDTLVKTLEISVLILFLWPRRTSSAQYSRGSEHRTCSPTLLALDVHPYVMLFIIMAVIFLMGWPLEWVPIVLIVVPFLLPLVDKLGFDKVWFGILVAVNLQTAWLSPPVAMSAYFLKGVVPQWDFGDIYKGMMQFMVLQILGLVLCIFIPQIVMWLPEYIYGK